MGSKEAKKQKEASMTSGELWVVEGKQYIGKWVPIPLLTFDKQEEATVRAAECTHFAFIEYRAVRYVRDESGKVEKL